MAKRNYKIRPGVALQLREDVEAVPLRNMSASNKITVPKGTRMMAFEVFRDYGFNTTADTTLDVNIEGRDEPFRLRVDAPSRSFKVIKTPFGMELPFPWLSVTQGRYRLKVDINAARKGHIYMIPAGSRIDVSSVDRHDGRVTLDFVVLCEDRGNLSFDECYPEPKTFSFPEGCLEVCE